MFEKYIVVEEGFQNVRENGQITGFQVRARIAEWRGMPLSMIEDVSVRVDGEEFPRENTSLSVGGHTYPVTTMKNEAEARWQFDEVAVITVQKPGGLTPGIHDVEVSEVIRLPLAALNQRMAVPPTRSVGQRKMTLVL